MPGVRLHHPTLRAVMFVIPHPFRKLVSPMLCAHCSKEGREVVHENKTYHLRLDGEGNIIVSETVLERLKEIGLAGLLVLNEVKHPPPQKMAVEFLKGSAIVRHSEEGRPDSALRVARG